MGKATTASKHKYNKGSYKRYEIYVGVDTKLQHLLEWHKASGGNVGGLIKECLANHFDISVDELYTPYHYEMINGERVKVENVLEPTKLKT